MTTPADPRYRLWRAPTPLVLASGSTTRRALLEAAGIPVDVVLPRLDERALDEPARAAGVPAAARARLLARAKALAGSALSPSRLVLGADQTLEGAGHPGVKARDRAEARAFLAGLAGKRHALHSAACLARDGLVVWEGRDSAFLTLRAFGPAFLDAYLEAVGDVATNSVGGYQIEGLGVHLVESIVGEHAVVLGLPLGRLLGELRRAGCLAG